MPLQNFPATSEQKVVLLSLTEKDRGIWTDPYQVNLQVVRRGPIRYLYLWDLFRLAERIGTPESEGYYTVDPDPLLWHQIWPGNIDDDAGSRVFGPLKTGYAIHPFNQPQANKYFYSGSMGLSPLLPQPVDSANEPIVSETIEGELALWRTFVFPAEPYLLASTTPNHQHYGPVFTRRATISASGIGSMSMVDVEVEFTGGRAIRSPKIEASTYPFKLISVVESSLDPLERYVPYRTAALMDCLAGASIWTNPVTMREDLELANLAEKTNAVNRLVGMELEIRQEVNFDFTCPDSADGRTDENGPRYAAITDREVTGKLTYYSREEKISFPLASADNPNPTQLTLFFGGAFFFSMPRIEMQPPQASLKAGKGWLHTFEFLARSAPGSVTHGAFSGLLPTSEFSG